MGFMMVYSADLKKKVVKSYLNNEGSIRVLAKRFKVAPSTLQKWLNRYRKILTTTPRIFMHGLELELFRVHTSH